MNITAAGALVGNLEAKDFSTKRRKNLAKKGFAKPDGSYPIEDEQDVHNAVSDFHRASGSPSDKAHIRTRAKALGMGDPFSNVKAGGPGSGRKPESDSQDSNDWRELPDSNDWRELPDSNRWREIPEPVRAGGPGSGRHPGVDAYIKAIKNPKKKEYATKYANFLQDGEPDGKEPGHGLTYMGAQSVRHSLRQIMGK